MKSITFTQDYRGVLTNEQPYLKGDTVIFPGDQALKLVEAGRAEWTQNKRTDAVDNVVELTLKELRELAKEKNIPGYAKMKKATLLRKLQ